MVFLSLDVVVVLPHVVHAAPRHMHVDRPSRWSTLTLPAVRSCGTSLTAVLLVQIPLIALTAAIAIVTVIPVVLVVVTIPVITIPVVTALLVVPVTLIAVPCWNDRATSERDDEDRTNENVFHMMFLIR
jgi:hypothetical protein